MKEMFSFNTYKKRITKYIGRGDIDKGKRYKENHKPEYSLVHCVKERYPTFIEAIRELDDPLSHIFLYSLLPAHLASDSTIEGHAYLTMGLSRKSQVLAQRWNKYIIKAQGLRKAFISVKGYYYQADVMGQTVTWLVPHHYTTTMPGEVDYHVMLTFLEFYTVHLDFVLFRLEHDLQGKAKTEKQKQEEEEEDDVQDPMAEDFPMSPEDQAAQRQTQQCSTLFNGFRFFFSTEVPLEPISFICRALGGTVSTDASEATITHQVTDRPHLTAMVPNRDYVQPQWVVDCLNCKHVLPVDQYRPGQDLPPHLSPFEEGMVTDHQGRAYEPERLKELKRIMDPTYKALAARLEEKDSDKEDDDDSADETEPEAPSEDEAVAPVDGIVTDDDDDDEDDAEEAEEEEGARPSKAPAPAAAPTQPARDKAEAMRIALERKDKRELAEKRMRASMLSGKKRKLWEKIQFSQKRKDQAVTKLDETRKMISEGKLKVMPQGYLADPTAAKKKNKGKRKSKAGQSQ